MPSVGVVDGNSQKIINIRIKRASEIKFEYFFTIYIFHIVCKKYTSLTIKKIKSINTSLRQFSAKPKIHAEESRWSKDERRVDSKHSIRYTTISIAGA